MLLELADLDRSLRDAGIIPGVTEQRIQPYPRRPALEVRLDRDGQVAGLRLLGSDQLQAIRKFECSKGALRESTPGFNVDPLWRAGKGDRPFELWLKEWRKAWKSAAADNSMCARLLEQRAIHREANWDFSESSKINACLGKAATTLRNELVGATDTGLLALLELLARSEAIDSRRLHETLSDALLAAATSGSGGLIPNDCRKLLYSDREPGSRKPAPNEGFSLVLELDDATRFGGCPVNHQAVWDALNQHLIAKQTTSESEATTPGTAAKAVGIFGEPLPAKIGSMREQTLPRVGKVKLFSLSAQTPCQIRYGLIESDACPVGPEVQDRLSAALEWVCREEREGQTWADVSNACGYKKQSALLLAYPSKMLADGPRLSEMMVSRRRDTASVVVSRFETQVKKVVSALKGLIAEVPDLSITVVVIAKADTARKKLLYSRQFTARRMIDAAYEWLEAARNHPAVFIRTFEADAPVWRRPPIPFPDQVVRLINTCWDSQGEKSQVVSNVRIGLALSLLLETGHTLAEAVHEALRVLVSNVTPLVLALARAHIQNRVAKAATTGDIPHLVPSILGLLLAKAGHKKGDYMAENAYLIGRLMSLADEFHRNYCRHERKGLPLPPSLIGNSLMPTALENPTAGLARLAERLTLYQRVADTGLRDEAGAVSRGIDKNALPPRCSDAEKAQMLLGYLARPSGEGRTEITTDSDADNPEETKA
jgi:CRISPR-associated protein (Cas_Csd1)